MDRDERIRELEAEIAQRAPTIAHLPDGHFTREAMLRECAGFTEEIEQLKQQEPASFGARFAGAVMIAAGLFLFVDNDGVLSYSGIGLALFGLFIIIGA